MGEGPEIPDDRGLVEDETLKAAHADSNVEAALLMMQEKFAQLEGRDERIAQAPNVKRAEQIMHQANRGVDEVKRAEKQLVSDLQEHFPNDDPRFSGFINEVMEVWNEYDKNKIDRDQYLQKIRSINLRVNTDPESGSGM